MTFVILASSRWSSFPHNLRHTGLEAVSSQNYTAWKADFIYL